MKKILIAILISSGVYGNTIECNELAELMQVVTNKCAVTEPTQPPVVSTHIFTQAFNKDVTGTVEYEDGEVLSFVTVNKVLSVNIAPDRPFRLKADGFISDRFKLSLLSDGDESWKYFFEGTNRWRNYDFSVIIILDDIVVTPEPPVVVVPTKDYPIITHSGTQVPTKVIASRIINEAGQPIPNIEVKLVGARGWEYLDITNANGEFSFSVTDGGGFTLYAWNKTLWAKYDEALTINDYGSLFMRVGTAWVVLAQIDDIVI